MALVCAHSLCIHLTPPLHLSPHLSTSPPLPTSLYLSPPLFTTLYPTPPLSTSLHPFLHLSGEESGRHYAGAAGRRTAPTRRERPGSARRVERPVARVRHLFGARKWHVARPTRHGVPPLLPCRREADGGSGAVGIILRKGRRCGLGDPGDLGRCWRQDGWMEVGG